MNVSVGVENPDRQGELYGVEEARAMIERALADGPETATK